MPDRQNKQVDKSSVFILITDDIERNLQVLGEILTAEGLRFAAAMNGKRALEIVRFRKPDLILLDIMMPEMDGYEVCTRLKSDPATADIPVIFLTATNDKDSIVRGFEVGAVDYVTKPFHSAELLARVYAHLELRKTRETLLDTNEKLRQSNDMKDRLFSLVAHDLRGPFQTFIGTADLLTHYMEKLPREQLVHISKRLMETSQNLFTMTDNLLTWARAQMNQNEIIHQQIDMKVVVDNCFALFENKAREKNLHLANIVGDGLIATVDTELLNTLLRNLVSNAVKFTPANGHITVYLTREGGKIHGSVTDTGVGIESAALEHILTRDTHYTTPGTAGEKGTGLGLLLCKELLEHYGGAITVESVVGQGTTFRFSIREETVSAHIPEKMMQA